MADKPKSYICGKWAKAACSLIDHLKESGILAEVGYAERNRTGLIVRPRSQSDLKKLPSEWHGIPIMAVIPRPAEKGGGS